MGSCCSNPHRTTDEEEIELQPIAVISPAPAPAPAITVSAAGGHSNVSRPPPPPRLTRLSEIIDPATLTPSSHIRTPSGDLLGRDEYLARPSRPRTIAERQDVIRARLAARSMETMSVGTRGGGSEVFLLAPPSPVARRVEERVRVRAGLRGARMVEIRRGRAPGEGDGGRDGVAGALGRWFGVRE